MDLQQIKYFLAVVDHGSFNSASKQVFVSQPTLSAGIKKLEQSLNVTLFERGSRHATLTKSGEQFLHPARSAYNQLLSAKSELMQKPKRIVIGVLSNIHMDHVSAIIRSHRMAYPHILIELIVGDDDELNRKLRDQTIDLAIVNSNSKSENFTPLISEQLCVVTSVQHPLATKSTVMLKSLKGELLIERTHCDFWHEVDNAFTEQNIIPQTVMQAHSDEFVLSLVTVNLGISIMTERSTPYEVKFLPIKDIQIDRKIGISISSKNTLEHVQYLYDSVVQLYKK
ncbi:LysR family transcriptional regulator [Vibrio harveyi]|nr:LysR family transcriptional regulator [Vibrio harveyi]